MKKLVKSASRVFRKDDSRRPLPVLHEDPGLMTALPIRQYSHSVEEDIGCLPRFSFKRKRALPVYTIDDETQMSATADCTSVLGADTNTVNKTVQTVEDMSTSTQMPDTVTINDEQQQDPRHGPSVASEPILDPGGRSFSGNSSLTIRPRVRLPPSSSEVWTTVEESAEDAELLLTRQARQDRRRVVSDISQISAKLNHGLGRRGVSDGTGGLAHQQPSNSLAHTYSSRRNNGESQQHQLRRVTTVVSSEQSSLGRRKVSSFSLGSIQEQAFVEPTRCLSRAPNSRVQIKKKTPIPAPVPETPKKATDWADMDDSFSDNSSELRQLREELRVSSKRIYTPSLSSHRRMRAAQAARVVSDVNAPTATIEEGIEDQANDIFFIPSPTMPKEDSFYGRGFVGSVASLPSTVTAISSPPISPRLLRIPLPKNCVELLHEAAGRCDGELARLRLNIRMMKQNKTEAEDKIRDLQPILADKRAKWFEMAAIFEANIKECEALGVSLEGIDAIDDVHESMLSDNRAGGDTELGYEAEMADFDSSAAMLEEHDRQRKGMWSATVEDEVVFEGDDSQDEAFAGYEADLSGEDEIEMTRAEERRSARLMAAERDPVEDLAQAALRF